MGTPGRSPGAPSPSASELLAVAVLLDSDGLDRRQLAVDDRMTTELDRRRVAVLVDVVRAGHADLVLGLEHLIDHGLTIAALAARTLHGVEGEVHRLEAVDRVGLRVALAIRLLEVGVELLALGRVVLRVDRGHRD